MKHSFRYLIPVALVLFQACNPDDPTPDNKKEEETPSGPVSISVTIDQGTRTSVSETTGAITFSKGDAIKIFNGKGVYLGITQSTQSTAMFSMADGFTATGSGYAGFPANLVTDITSNGVTFNLPSSYKYSQVGGSDADASKVPCPMVGTFTGGGGISLKPVCALVRFYLTDVTAGTLTFTFQGSVAGETTVITPSGTNDGIRQSNLGNEDYGAITVTGIPEVEVNEYIYITLPVPVGTSTQNIIVTNNPADVTVKSRVAVVSGGSGALATGHGHKFVDITLREPAFSVSASKRVFFSLGNLQYIGSAETPYWKFAENQWDYLGSTTGQNSTATNRDRDLFGWGTGNEPNRVSTSVPSFVDWGVNPISNGGEYSWRTLTKDEWVYLINTRFGYRYAKAQVHGVNGLIIFPDGFTFPSGVAIDSPNVAGADFTANPLSDDDWSSLDWVGCIFLPAAGSRAKTTLYSVGDWGDYWSSTPDDTHAYGLSFNHNSVTPNVSAAFSWYGYAVRLVRDE